MISSLLIIACTFSISVLAHAGSKERFTMMSYNAENLFNAVHDEGTDDYEYLPLELKEGIYANETRAFCGNKGDCANKDWTDAVYKKKLQNIAKSILSYNNGKGADVVMMQEVENIQVLNDLIKTMPNSGYKYVQLIEGKDKRGIDPGAISKIPFTSSKLHLPADAKGVKRGTLEVNLLIKNVKVTLMSNHWPSQANPVADRMTAAKIVEKAVKDAAASDIIVSAGDFNTTETEKPNAVEYMKNLMVDARSKATELGVKLFPGSYKHGGKWGSLDRIFVKVQNSKKILPIYETFNVYAPLFILKSKGNVSTFKTGKTPNPGPSDSIDYNKYEPFRFDYSKNDGFSDHLPSVISFEIQ